MKKQSKLKLIQNSESMMSQNDEFMALQKQQLKKETTIVSNKEQQVQDQIDDLVLRLINQQQMRFRQSLQKIANGTQKLIYQKQQIISESECNGAFTQLKLQNVLQSQQTKTLSAQIFNQTKVCRKQKNYNISEDQQQQSNAKNCKIGIEFSKYEFKAQQCIQKKQDILKGKKRVQSMNKRIEYSSHKYNFAQKMIVVDPNLLEFQKQFQINNVPIYFPYDAYPLQIDYMRAVIEGLSTSQNAILQSPTGTGKTLCLLCSVLSWVQHHSRSAQLQMKQKYLGQKTRIVYISRTHNQLKQVQQELQKTCFRPTMANFGSRDQFCVKKQYKQFKGRDLMEACSKGVKLALKAKRKLEIQEQPIDDPGLVENILAEGHACSYYKSESEYSDILQKRYINKIIDSETIKKDGEAYGFCPYYYPFQIQQKADIIFMPYNYILDVGLLLRYKQIIKNSILIFDQAHNVPESACQGRSLTLSSKIFDHINVQLAKLQYHPRMSAQLRQVAYEYENIIKLIEKSTTIYRKNIQGQVETIFDQSLHQNQSGMEQIEKILAPAMMRRLFYRFFYPGKRIQNFDIAPEKVKKQIHLSTLKNLNYLVQQSNLLIQALKETFDGIFQNLEKFMGFLSKVYQLIQNSQQNMSPQWWKQQINHYRLSLKINSKDKETYEIKLICLTPSLTFSQIRSLNPLSIILTSGTLAPLNSWQKQLNIKFKVQLINPHIIAEDQLHLATVCRNEGKLNFSFKQIQARKDTYKDLVNTIATLLNLIPNGVLIIFPSYRIINQFKNQLRYNRNSLQCLKDSKQILFEEKGTDEYLLQRFKQKARSKKGIAMICVCRGKISQGIDLADQLCRAVIFIGVPFASVNDPMIKEKKIYLDALAKQNKNQSIKSLTGDEWYNLSTMRAVNQGIGRVIRHINDYGMIFLLDERYEQYRLKNMLPRWSKVNSRKYDDFDEVKQCVDTFFKRMKQKFPSNDKKNDGENRGEEITKIEGKPKQNAFQFMMLASKNKHRKLQNKRVSNDKTNFNLKKKNIYDFL